MSKTLPVISVIMSTYNRKNFLPRALESILSQTFKNFELILVNNGSTDGSNKICEEYKKKDSRIKVITVKENLGAPIGKNAGLDAASSKYLTFVDDDDQCEPQMLEFLWDLANEYHADISLCGSWNVFNGKKEPYFIFKELLVLDKVQGIDELLKREKYNVAPPTKLFRKSLFEEIRFKENVIVDDIHIIYKVFSKAHRVVAHGRPLYHFTKHNNNMTSFIQTNNLSPELLNEYLSAFRERTKYLSTEVPEITMRAKYSEWSFMLSMCYKIKKYNCTSCAKLYNVMAESIRASYQEWLDSPFITKREKKILPSILNLSSNLFDTT
ncbi:glycosyl transferase [Bacillus manliponensis]|uniref:Glycosyl transferase n=1 Tax=Bacillus manliponensis TaxID=574376 RepID=A0A073KD39_9BACI|nr:glycosyltransferase family 2 protein [Bacillus manliponensis]KEK20238.1 glycosyl transferase [Bacillus manliponensis]